MCSSDLTKVFEVVDQYISPFTGEALDVALIDYTRRFFEEQTWGGAFPNLFNTGSVLLTLPGINLPRNAKYPLAGLSAAGTQANNPRWQPDLLYLSVTGGRIVSFDVFNPQGTPSVIETPRDVRTLTSYFSQ